MVSPWRINCSAVTMAKISINICLRQSVEAGNCGNAIFFKVMSFQFLFCINIRKLAWMWWNLPNCQGETCEAVTYAVLYCSSDDFFNHKTQHTFLESRVLSLLDVLMMVNRRRLWRDSFQITACRCNMTARLLP